MPHACSDSVSSRPSLLALRSTRLHGYGERFLAVQHDPLLEDFWKRVQDHPVHHTAALFDVTVALTTQLTAKHHHAGSRPPQG